MATHGPCAISRRASGCGLAIAAWSAAALIGGIGGCQRTSAGQSAQGSPPAPSSTRPAARPSSAPASAPRVPHPRIPERAAAPLLGGELGLDHVGVAVRDLEAARVAYEALGFAFAARGKLPNGLENYNFYFSDTTYLELLTTWDRAKNKWVAGFIDRHGRGCMFMVLSVASAEGAARYLAGRGHAMSKPLAGSIETAAADRSDRPLWHTLYFERSPLPADNLFFIAYDEQRRRQNLERMRAAREAGTLRQHPNSALGLRAVWVAVEDLATARRAYESIGLAAGRELELPQLGGRGVEILAGIGSILLLAPAGPEAPLARFIGRRGNGALAGMTLRVASLPRARRAVEAGIGQQVEPFTGVFGPSILVPPEKASDVWLEMVEPGPAI
ncbi:MAG: VOC family protein [Deltaproteobacteria bacterium]|nr:VOC family protein [Deltaproteobacteria bacterium]